jgi:hypothetical protein
VTPLSVFFCSRVLHEARVPRFFAPTEARWLLLAFTRWSTRVPQPTYNHNIHKYPPWFGAILNTLFPVNKEMLKKFPPVIWNQKTSEHHFPHSRRRISPLSPRGKAEGRNLGFGGSFAWHREFNFARKRQALDLHRIFVRRGCGSVRAVTSLQPSSYLFDAKQNSKFCKRFILR